MQPLFLLQTRINHVNKYAIDGAMKAFFYSELASITPTVTRLVAQCKPLFLLRTRINHANRYAVVGAMQTLFLL